MLKLHRDYSTWALDRSILSPSLEIAHTDHGLGLRTRVPVAHGEVLVNASSLALTAARALALRPDIADLLEPHVDVEPHVALAVWLMRAVEAPQEFHDPWLRALPRTLDCTLLWSPSELALLQSSAAARKARHAIRWSEEEAARIFRWTAPVPSELAAFRWALCAVWSRSFHVAAEPGAPLVRVLAPIADLPNHAHPHAPTAERDKAGTLVLRAARALDAGEAVELDYGGRPNAELLTTHGFALADAPHEEVELELAPAEGDALGALKARILREGNITAPYALSLRALRTDSDLVLALRILSATAAELPHYARAFHGEPLSDDGEARWRELLRARVEGLLAAAESATTAAADEALMEALPERKGRAWAALATRHGEKRLLRDALEELGRARVAVPG